jgi:hypothetical protein
MEDEGIDIEVTVNLSEVINTLDISIKTSKGLLHQWLVLFVNRVAIQIGDTELMGLCVPGNLEPRGRVNVLKITNLFTG